MTGANEELESGPVDADVQPIPTPTHQFGIPALFWTTFVLGLGLAYLQRLDSPEILIGGMLAVAIGLAAGGLIGLLTRRIADGAYWGTLVGAFAFISVSGDPMSYTGHRLIWALVGASCGAVAATVLPQRGVLNALATGIVAGLIMAAYSPFSQRRLVDAQFDVYAAPLIGVAVAIFVRSLMWLERKRRVPRYMTATWLLTVVIIGNALSI